jgi:hypothetical protein
MARGRLQQRFIAFVDILGFRALVERMPGEDGLFAAVRDALSDVHRQSLQFGDYRRNRKAKVREGAVPLTRNTDLRMTAFSDCYVLSEISPAWHVLAAVQALGSRLLAAGILTRGAVVQGNAYHDSRVLFGPGIIEAYDLESKVAGYPRILVTEPVRRAVKGYDEGHWSSRLLQRDADGFWFVNLLTPSLSSWAPLSTDRTRLDTKSYLMRVRRSLLDQRKRAKGNASHMSKVGWLIHKFNRAAKEEGLDQIHRFERSREKARDK